MKTKTLKQIVEETIDDFLEDFLTFSLHDITSKIRALANSKQIDICDVPANVCGVYVILHSDVKKYGREYLNGLDNINKKFNGTFFTYEGSVPFLSTQSVSPSQVDITDATTVPSDKDTNTSDTISDIVKLDSRINNYETQIIKFLEELKKKEPSKHIPLISMKNLRRKFPFNKTEITYEELCDICDKCNLLVRYKFRINSVPIKSVFHKP